MNANDPNVLLALCDPTVAWHEAISAPLVESAPLAHRVAGVGIVQSGDGARPRLFALHDAPRPVERVGQILIDVRR